MIMRRLLATTILCSCLSGALGSSAQDSPLPTRALELDGNGSYVQLPDNIFKNLTEATVEVWANWTSFQMYSRVFEFGATYESMSVFNHAATSDLRFNIYPEFAPPSSPHQHIVRVADLLRTNEWVHLAAVSGPGGGMELYVNGLLAGRHTSQASFADLKVSQRSEHELF
jgi:hypothetical protein